MRLREIQFQRGRSMAGFLERYCTEDGLRGGADRLALAAGLACPVCGGPAGCSFRRESRLFGRCASCRHQSSVIGGTIFESTKLPLTGWFLALHLPTQSKTTRLGPRVWPPPGRVVQDCWLAKHKVKEVMRLREDARQLSGRVEIDGAFGRDRGAATLARRDALTARRPAGAALSVRRVSRV
jgi:hypothetical protein